MAGVDGGVGASGRRRALHAESSARRFAARSGSLLEPRVAKRILVARCGWALGIEERGAAVEVSGEGLRVDVGAADEDADALVLQAGAQRAPDGRGGGCAGRFDG